MKQIEKLQAKARQRFGFCGSLIIHFILFVALAFSGVFAMQPPPADAAGGLAALLHGGQRHRQHNRAPDRHHHGGPRRPMGALDRRPHHADHQQGLAGGHKAQEPQGFLGHPARRAKRGQPLSEADNSCLCPHLQIPKLFRRPESMKSSSTTRPRP